MSLLKSGLRLAAAQGARATLIAYAAMLVFAWILLGYTGKDDKFITYFVADTIAAGSGIVNYSGEIIEQSSSLLFSVVLALAVYVVPGASAADLGPLVSVMFLVAFTVAILVLLRRIDCPAAAMLAICLQVPAVYWSLAGMEVSLYLFLLTLFVYFVNDLAKSRIASCAGLFLSTFFLSLTRPEAPIVVACALVAITVAAGALVKLAGGVAPAPRERVADHARKLAMVAAGAAFAFGARLLLGLKMFPNPVYAKNDLGLAERFDRGFAYFNATYEDHPALSLVAVLAFLFSAYRILVDQGNQRYLRLSLVSLVAAVGAFSLLVGGDHMESGRFLVPAFTFTLLALMLSLDAEGRGAVICAVAAIFVLEVGHTATERYGGVPALGGDSYEASNFRPAIWERFSRTNAGDTVFTDRLIEEMESSPKSELTIASIQAGFTNYYLFRNTTKKIRFVDLKGLSTADLHGCPAFGGDPFDKWEATKACLRMDEDFDYVFDASLDDNRVAALENDGCEEILRTVVTFDRPWWKEPYTRENMLYKCK